MQSCGLVKQRQQAGVGLRADESPGANGGMIFQGSVENMNADIEEGPPHNFASSQN